MIKNWQTEDGLPEDSATAMVQTSDGYLWFGTFNGLVRFDGVKFTVYDQENTPGLPSSAIVNLHLDKKGRLWVSTYGGLVVRDGAHWQVLTSEDMNKGEYVRTFTERANGDLLLTKFNGKIVEWSKGRLTELPPTPGGNARGCFGRVDELGQWWVLQHEFIGRWDGRAWVPTIAVNGAPESIGWAGAKDGGFWLLQGRELRKFSRGVEVSHVQLPEFPGVCWSMSEDSRGNVWICMLNKGLLQVSAGGEIRRWDEDNGLPYHGVRFAFEDADNNIWIGTSGGGLVRLKARRFQNYGVESGLSERVVKSVWPAPAGGLWIMTYGKGLFRLDAAGITNVDVLQWTNINQSFYGQSVLTDKSGRTWAGTYNSGLLVSGPNGFERVPAEELRGANVVAEFEDSRGRIWFSADEVSEYDSGTFHKFGTEQGLPRGQVWCFGEDREGVIWLSNLRGLFRLEKERFVEVRDPQNRSIPEITCIKGDSKEGLWLGSERVGLLRLRKGFLSTIGAEAGLSVTSIHGVIEDDQGFFWLTSNRGLVHARREDLESATKAGSSPLFCQVFDLSDGLPSVEFPRGQPTCAKDAQGRLWFATLKGVAMADPGRFRVNAHPPPVTIEEVVYHPGSESEVEGGQTGRRLRAPFLEPMELPAGSRNIEIHYTALSFTSPEKVRFQIRLQSRGEQWQDVGGRRVAYFDELRPGKNLFQVRAANEDGVWNETGASLAFTMAPLFWQTGWFRALAWVAVGCETVLIIALLRAMERRRRTKVELRERLQFEQLISELSRVFINLPSVEIEAQIMEALRRVGEELKFDIAAFSTWSGGAPGGGASLIWRRAGVNEISFQRMEEELPWSASELGRGRDVWLPSVSNLPPEATKDRATYAKYGVQSAYQVPVHAGRAAVATFSLCAVKERPKLTRELLQRQRLIGEVFANALMRKRAEEHQRESEARFRIVADSAPVMIWMSGVDKLCTFFNKTWLDFTGRALEQELGNGWAEGIHQADKAGCVQAYEEAFDARRSFVLQYRLRRHDGEYRWISDHGVPRYDAQKEFAGYVGSCMDFTERKQAEEKFRLAVDTSPNAILLVDERGRIVMANRQAEVTFGYTAEELMGRPIEILVPERSRGEHAGFRHEFHGSPRTRPMGEGRELFARRKDGSEIEVEIGLNPIHAQNEILVLTTIVDVTEHRRMDVEMQKLRQELAHSGRVTMIGQLASALAHELSQPLGAILRNAEAAELFLRGPNPDLEEVRSIVTDIRQDDQRAGAVIERLRLLLKRGDIEMQTLDAGRLAEEILPLLRPDAQGRRVALELEKASNLPLVRGDRVQLQQVLLNLVMNAMDAVSDLPMDRRKVNVQVRPDGERFVAVSVSDAGQGIQTTELERIFEPFFTTKPQGMGMGLSISRTIVEAHGGRICAVNNPEGGAMFRFTLPVANGRGGKGEVMSNQWSVISDQ